MNSTTSIQNYLYGNNKRSYLNKRAGFSDLTAGLPKPEDMSDLEYELMHNKAKSLKDSLNKSVDTLLDYYDKEKMNPVQYFLHKNKDDLMTYGSLGAGALGLGVGGLALYLRHKDKKKKEREMEELGLGKEAATKLSLLKRLSTGAKDFMNSSTNKISEGIKNIMRTPFSNKQMLKALKDAARKNVKDPQNRYFTEKYNAANKAGRLDLIKDQIYANRINAIKSLTPTLNEGLIGTSGLGLGYLLGSDSDDSE